MKLTKSKLKQIIEEEWRAAVPKGMMPGEELPLASRDRRDIRIYRDEFKKTYTDPEGIVRSRETGEPLTGAQLQRYMQALMITQGRDKQLGGPSIAQDAFGAQPPLHHTTDTNPSLAQVAYEE